MTSPTSGSARPDPGRIRFQYSVATLLIVTVVVALACSAFFAMPIWVGVVGALFLVISTPAALCVVVIYARGYRRTFSIGALFPAAVFIAPTFISLFGLQFLYGPFGDLDENRFAIPIFIAVYYVFVLANGLIAVGLRRMVEASQRRGAQQSPFDDRAPRGSHVDSDSAGVSGEEP
jgi:hypothetical protein